MTDALKRLSDEGVAIWLDDLSRKRLNSGNLAELVQNRHVVGVTTNPTIFQKAIAGSGDTSYDGQLRDLAVRKVTTEEAVRMITTSDVRDAADVLRPVYDASNGRDGRVSIEVDPRLAHETAPTVAEAKQLWWLVDRPNVFIKIPATKAGLPAISEVIGLGISVNVTLIFSLERYRAVMQAFQEGLAKAREAGLDVLGISLVTNLAAGISGEALSHEEVLEAGREAGPRISRLLAETVRRITTASADGAGAPAGADGGAA